MTLPGGNTGQHLPAPRQAQPSFHVEMALLRGLLSAQWRDAASCIDLP